VSKIVWAAPILPDKVEAWRRLCQELRAGRSNQFAESRQRLGVTREVTWLFRTGQSELALLCLDAEQPEQLLVRLAASNQPFDLWFKRQLLDICGLDLSQAATGPTLELMLDWQPQE
jgi:hypothetical protein